jgi:hypothetical protein
VVPQRAEGSDSGDPLRGVAAAEVVHPPRARLLRFEPRTGGRIREPEADGVAGDRDAQPVGLEEREHASGPEQEGRFGGGLSAVLLERHRQRRSGPRRGLARRAPAGVRRRPLPARRHGETERKRQEEQGTTRAREE